MTGYIIIFVFFIAAFLFMALALHFSQFRRRRGTCCTDVLGEIEGEDFEACYTCPNRDADGRVVNEVSNAATET